MRLIQYVANNPHKGAAVLVARAKAGDTAAFEQLVRRYRQRILALCLHLTGNEGDAEDITQEVFLRAYRALAKFEGRSEFFTWVYRMAVNRSLNARRDRKRRREDAMDDPRVHRAVAIDAAGDPLLASELRNTYTHLLTELDRLPPEMATSVVLVALQGLSHAEAAVVQKCPTGTVAWRMHEARKRLRKAMERRPRRMVSPPNATALSPELTDLLREWGLPHQLMH